jgi:hypothetical protein
MKNKLEDLNDHLFDQLERLLDDEICKDVETTEREIRKAGAICNISTKIIEITNTQIEGIKLRETWNLKSANLPRTLSIGSDKIIK